LLRDASGQGCSSFAKQDIRSIAAAKAWNANEMAYWKKLTENVKVERPE
jgi:hypothetical protein